MRLRDGHVHDSIDLAGMLICANEFEACIFMHGPLEPYLVKSSVEKQGVCCLAA